MDWVCMRASEHDTGGEQRERDRQELEVIEVSDDEDDGLMLLPGSIPDFITLTAMSTTPSSPCSSLHSSCSSSASAAYARTHHHYHRL